MEFRKTNIGRDKVILKRLNNSNSNNVKWFQEVSIILAFNNFMITYNRLDNYHSFTWFQKYNIIYDITSSLDKIHIKNVAHRDLHMTCILGILMWEIATGEAPFGEHEHDIDLQFAIVNVTLMKQCWDTNPDNRPNADTIYQKMESLIKESYNEMDKKSKKYFKINKK
ncbi:hypothetical protein Glove_82g59 [Diversispora epigaea]|uniref:Protein kinase domain-containing protein n=1 Tax=Diversispora epigaea TaxID=1348612 RepID=A0A397JBE1_9GLOM|nr:hypothetical protein Glove_82g59 [Diversispora epigaea]